MLAFICFRIVEINSHQRVQLAHTESGESLKVKVPYDQVRPHATSNLHDRSLEPSESKKLIATVSADKMGITDSQPTVPGPLDNLKATVCKNQTKSEICGKVQIFHCALILDLS